MRFEGGWKGEEGGFRGCGGRERKERVLVGVKKYRIMFISVYFLVVWGGGVYVWREKKKYMGEKEDIEKREKKMMLMREEGVMVDREVGEVYGVERRGMKEGLKKNGEKFGEGYVMEVREKEKEYVVENLEEVEKVKYCDVGRKGLREKGLYMVGRMVKCGLGREVRIGIVERLGKVGEVGRGIGKVNGDGGNGIVGEEEEEGRMEKVMGEVV